MPTAVTRPPNLHTERAGIVHRLAVVYGAPVAFFSPRQYVFNDRSLISMRKAAASFSSKPAIII